MRTCCIISLFLALVLIAACQPQPPTVVYIVFSPTPDGNSANHTGGASATDPLTATVTAVITPTPEMTATPNIFPTTTLSQIQVAEQVFEHGRMFWLQPTKQIWVLVVTGQGRGTWQVYDDKFEDGQPEFDPSIEPPQGLLQPMRGFGKLWRENPEVRQELGWAETPEFGYVSNYEYHPGGQIENGRYVGGPGYHVLFSLYDEAFRFNEADGTWQLGG